SQPEIHRPRIDENHVLPAPNQSLEPKTLTPSSSNGLLEGAPPHRPAPAIQHAPETPVGGGSLRPLHNHELNAPEPARHPLEVERPRVVEPLRRRLEVERPRAVEPLRRPLEVERPRAVEPAHSSGGNERGAPSCGRPGLPPCH